MQLFIKLDSDNNPIDGPLTKDNIKVLLDLASPTDQEILDAGYAFFERVDQPKAYRKWKTVSHNGYVLRTTDVYTDEWLIENKDGTPSADELVEYKNQLKELLSEIRYNHEIGGTELSDGTQIKTERDSQLLSYNVYQSLSNSLVSSTQWKNADGSWSSVTLSEMTPIVTAIASHVDKCFVAEKAVSESIDALSTIDEFDSFNNYSSFIAAYEAL